eukprot:UN29034
MDWVDSTSQPIIFVYLGQSFIPKDHLVEVLTGLLLVNMRIIWCLPTQTQTELFEVLRTDKISENILPSRFRLMDVDEMSHFTVIACLANSKVIGAIVHGGVTMVQEILYYENL